MWCDGETKIQEGGARRRPPVFGLPLSFVYFDESSMSA